MTQLAQNFEKDPVGGPVTPGIIAQGLRVLPVKRQDTFIHKYPETETKWMAYDKSTGEWHDANWGGYGDCEVGQIRVDTPKTLRGLVIYEMETQPDGTRSPVARIEGTFQIVWT